MAGLQPRPFLFHLFEVSRDRIDAFEEVRRRMCVFRDGKPATLPELGFLLCIS
jgi:hypothetical protein